MAEATNVSRAWPLLPALEIYLNGPDRQRADRFKFAEDRARFVLARGLLGRCLRDHLDYPVAPLNLALTPQGRPFLPEDPEVQFSLSHSHDWVAVAVSLGTRVGIDLELVQTDLQFPELAERIFSENDLQTFQSLSVEERPVAFFRAWTGKEAYLKANGVGIAAGMKEVSISAGTGAPTGRIADAGDAQAGKWCLEDLPLPAGYVGSVTWEDPRKRLNFRIVDLTVPK